MSQPHNPSGTRICTHFGHRLDLLYPHPHDIDIRDIAFGLAHNAVFAGQAPLTLAQHAATISDQLTVRGPQVALCGLLARAEEAYLGTLHPAALAALASFALGGHTALGVLTSSLRRTIRDAFGLPSSEPPEILVAARQVYAQEVWTHFPAERQRLSDWDFGALVSPPWSAPEVPCWSAAEAQWEFLLRFNRLSNPTPATFAAIDRHQALSG